MGFVFFFPVSYGTKSKDMKALIFNGALERRTNATSNCIGDYLDHKLREQGIESQIFKIADSGIPLFDSTLTKTPKAVELMNHTFREVDIHLWLTPLYHGSMTGAMKNCLDWLQWSAKLPKPYLTGKMVGLVCWADGVQALQGINAMDAVAKALRAWTSPYNVPINRGELYDDQWNISPDYQQRLQLLLQVLVQGPDTISA